MTDEPGHVGAAAFDQQSAFLVFNSLERNVVYAVQADEMDVAAGFAREMFTLADQLPVHWARYCDVSEQMADDPDLALETGAASAAINEAATWAAENDHPLAEEFDLGGDEA